MSKRLIYNCKSCAKVVYTEYASDTKSGYCRNCKPVKKIIPGYEVWDTSNPPTTIKARSPREAAERYLMRLFNSNTSVPGIYNNPYICVETRVPAKDKRFHGTKVVVFEGFLEIRSIASVTLKKIKEGN